MEIDGRLLKYSNLIDLVPCGEGIWQKILYSVPTCLASSSDPGSHLHSSVYKDLSIQLLNQFKWWPLAPIVICFITLIYKLISRYVGENVPQLKLLILSSCCEPFNIG